MEQEAIWVFLLAGTVTFISVFIQIVSRIRPFQRVVGNKANWVDQVVLIILFGGFSVMGTYMGVRLPSGAITNVRDLGPIIAGLTGGPLVGLGAGLIGGVHRYFLGGFTQTACGAATVLIGLTSGLIRRFNRNRLIGFWHAVLCSVLMECFHMVLVLIMVRPFADALDVVKMVSFPMILANMVGVAVSFILIDHAELREIK